MEGPSPATPRSSPRGWRPSMPSRSPGRTPGSTPCRTRCGTASTTSSAASGWAGWPWALAQRSTSCSQTVRRGTTGSRSGRIPGADGRSTSGSSPAGSTCTRTNPSTRARPTPGPTSTRPSAPRRTSSGRWRPDRRAGSGDPPVAVEDLDRLGDGQFGGRVPVPPDDCRRREEGVDDRLLRGLDGREEQAVHRGVVEPPLREGVPGRVVRHPLGRREGDRDVPAPVPAEGTHAGEAVKGPPGDPPELARGQGGVRREDHDDGVAASRRNGPPLPGHELPPPGHAPAREVLLPSEVRQDEGAARPAAAPRPGPGGG